MIDILIALLIAVFARLGYKRGFISTLVNAVSTILSLVFGIVLAKPLSIVVSMSPLGDTLREISKNIIAKNLHSPDYNSAIMTDAITMLLSTVICFVLAAVIIRALVWILTDVLKLVAKLPVIKQANSFLGLLMGIITAILICYTFFGVVAALNMSAIISNEAFIKGLESSFAARIFYHNNIIADTLIKFI